MFEEISRSSLDEVIGGAARRKARRTPAQPLSAGAMPGMMPMLASRPPTQQSSMSPLMLGMFALAMSRNRR